MPRKGAHQLPRAAVASGLETFLAEFSIRRLPNGRAAVVRNDHHPERAVQTGIGPVTAQNPKVRSKTGTPVTFHSALVPPCLRKAKTIVRPSPGSISRAFPPERWALPGADAKGFPTATVARLKTQWAAEYDIWRKSDPGRDEWACIRADGTHSGLRGGDDLGVNGVNARGEKRFLAMEDGVRESTRSWRELLLALKDRGLSTPKLALGDGAMDFRAALEEIFPTTTRQRRWMHKTANVVNYLPKRSQPKARKALHDIWQAETREEAHHAFNLFIETYESVLTNHQVFDYIAKRREFVVSKVQGLVLLVRKPCTFET